jgi:hypothetical protein
LAKATSNTEVFAAIATRVDELAGVGRKLHDLTSMDAGE